MEPKNQSEALEAGYATSHRVYELCGITLTTVTGVWLIARLLSSTALSGWWVPAALIIGMLAADFVSGVVHWLFDTWGNVDTPIVGKLAIRTFRQHHVDPKAMLRHDFVETNGHNFMLASTLTVSALYFVPAVNASHTVWFIGMCFAATALFVSMTSQIHKWAHMDAPPRAIAMLQRARILLSPEHHQVHHTAPHQAAYCITVGWMDGPLDALGAFGKVERFVSWSTGVSPQRDEIVDALPSTNA